jgi:ribosomal protein S18 acetylase RimI-like enzyme
MSGHTHRLIEARSCEEFATARRLFQEYAGQLGVDLCFQDFASELAALSERYAPPGGCLLLTEPVGCGALRRLCEEVCEMKRLYVRPDARGVSLGRRLAASLILRARELGYGRMRLDTLAHMSAARHLYWSLGFHEIDAYYDSPLPDALYMELALRGGAMPSRT